MLNPLPRRVRRAIANINRMVDHKVLWGQYTQVTFAGECGWEVTGGPDWPHELEGVRVGLISTDNGEIEVHGLEAVNRSIMDHDQRLERPLRTDDFSTLANERDALRQVYQVLLSAKAEDKIPAFARQR